MNFADVQEWALTLEGISVWLTAIFGMIFIVMLMRAERSIRLGREAAQIALLAAVASASRVLFVAIPNVQPVTVFILLIGIHLGIRRVTAVAVLVALISNMALGHGPWTFYQALAWIAVGTSGSLFRKVLVSQNSEEIRLVPLAILGFIWGFLFDWIVSLQHLTFLQSIEMFYSFLISGIPLVILHAVGNVLFAIWLAPSLHRLFWLHQRHDAGRWILDIPVETQRREAFIAGAQDASREEHRLGDDPLAGIERLDVEVE